MLCLPRVAVCLSLLVGLGGIFGRPGSSQAATSKNARPNVVLVFVDDLGIGDIGPFGNTKFRTPNLDRLASQGRRFNSFYATPVCSMSRAALMTGCYNVRVSIPGVLFPPSRIGLNPAETTVAEVLKRQGYATTCIGKWHLGHLPPFLPTNQGFDSYFGIPYSNDMTIDPENAVFADECVFREGMNAEKARAEAIRNTVPLMRGEKIVEYPADQTTLTKRYTEEAIRFIHANKEGPFFLYLPHSMVHTPLFASEAFRGKSPEGLFGDVVEEMDWSVGQLMQTLDELKLADDTLFIFTSDNGAASGSSLPYRGRKGSTFEGGVREPCIMRWPGKIPAGTECNQIAGNIDVLPTLAAIAGAPLAADNTVAGREIDGRDISSQLFDPKAGPVRDVQLHFRTEQLQAIRKGDWKLFVKMDRSAREPFDKNQPTPQPTNAKRPGEAKKPNDAKSPTALHPPELYNLADDPYETKNVAAEKPELVAELEAEGRRREDEILAKRRPAGQWPAEKTE